MAVKKKAKKKAKKKSSQSLQSVVRKLNKVGVVPTKDLTAAQKRAAGKRSSAKRYQNQR